MHSATSQTASSGPGFPTNSAIVLYLWLQYQLIHCYAQEYSYRKIEIKLTIESFPMVMLWIPLYLLRSMLNTALTYPAGT